MPYKSDKFRIENEKLDKRVKLTRRQKLEIACLGRKSDLSQRALARMYNVSRRTITFILDPEKLEDNLKRRKERGGSKHYYERERHNKFMDKHRKYKRELFRKGLIGPDKKKDSEDD